MLLLFAGYQHSNSCSQSACKAFAYQAFIVPQQVTCSSNSWFTERRASMQLQKQLGSQLIQQSARNQSFHIQHCRRPQLRRLQSLQGQQQIQLLQSAWPPRQQHCLHQQQFKQNQPCSRSNSISSTVCQSAAAAAAYGDNSDSSNSSATGRFVAGITDTATEVKELALKFVGLWRQFLPMLSLFFCLSFINTMLDSLKDTLVITAVGGGAFVIPYLTVYAVLPISVVFLFLFSAASHRMSRSALFNTIIGVFMVFFGAFAVFMYPNADVLHPHALADQLQQVS